VAFSKVIPIQLTVDYIRHYRSILFLKFAFLKINKKYTTLYLWQRHVYHCVTSPFLAFFNHLGVENTSFASGIFAQSCLIQDSSTVCDQYCLIPNFHDGSNRQAHPFYGAECLECCSTCRMRPGIVLLPRKRCHLDGSLCLCTIQIYASISMVPSQ